MSTTDQGTPLEQRQTVWMVSLQGNPQPVWDAETAEKCREEGWTVTEFRALAPLQESEPRDRMREGYERDIAWLKRDLRSAREIIDGDYWLWQGDGEDHLESLTCPVVIRPDDLAALLASPRLLNEIDTELAELEDSAHGYVGGRITAIRAHINRRALTSPTAAQPEQEERCGYVNFDGSRCPKPLSHTSEHGYPDDASPRLAPVGELREALLAVAMREDGWPTMCWCPERREDGEHTVACETARALTSAAVRAKSELYCRTCGLANAVNGICFRCNPLKTKCIRCGGDSPEHKPLCPECALTSPTAAQPEGEERCPSCGFYSASNRNCFRCRSTNKEESVMTTVSEPHAPSQFDQYRKLIEAQRERYRTALQEIAGLGNSSVRRRDDGEDRVMDADYLSEIAATALRDDA